MNSLFSRMGTSWSKGPTDAPPPPGDGPRAPPPPPLAAPQPPGKDDDVYRPRDRSPDSVLEDVGAWARDDGSDASSAATPPPRALARAASAPAAASCGDLRGILADKPKKKLRKSVSFHSTVSLVRSESLSDLPAEEKHRIWYRSDDYSRFVHSELGRRREMGVTSTSLIMPTRVEEKVVGAGGKYDYYGNGGGAGVPHSSRVFEGGGNGNAFGGFPFGARTPPPPGSRPGGNAGRAPGADSELATTLGRLGRVAGGIARGFLARFAHIFARQVLSAAFRVLARILFRR